MTYEIHDVKGDGSCFYRSVYGAAKSNGVLDHILRCFTDLAEVDENKFVQLVRYYISERIRSKNDFNVIRDVHGQLSTLDKKDYAMVLKSMPSWFAKSFRTLPKSEMIFRNTIAEKILLNTSWAGEIDISIFMKVLHGCQKHVTLVILNNIPVNFKPKRRHLYVLNRGEVHYNYLSSLVYGNSPSHVYKPCPEGKMINPATKRCVKINGYIGKKLTPKVCLEGKIVNPKTNRCVKVNGKIGKSILAST